MLLVAAIMDAYDWKNVKTAINIKGQQLQITSTKAEIQSIDHLYRSILGGNALCVTPDRGYIDCFI